MCYRLMYIGYSASSISDCVFIIAYVIYVVFFFKQKTAYGMRISDWSSDVCSFDLVSNVTAAAIIAPALGEQICLQHEFRSDCRAIANLTPVNTIVGGVGWQKAVPIREEHRRQLAGDNVGSRYQTATSH